MHRSSDKLVAILLALLLGLAPLQGVLAGLLAVPQDTMVMHQAMEGMDSHGTQAQAGQMDHAEMDQHCDQCDMDHCCDGVSCSFSQCASCVLALPATLPLILASYTPILGPQPLVGLITRPLTSLFRPPRV